MLFHRGVIRQNQEYCLGRAPGVLLDPPANLLQEAREPYSFLPESTKGNSRGAFEKTLLKGLLTVARGELPPAASISPHVLAGLHKLFHTIGLDCGQMAQVCTLLSATVWPFPPGSSSAGSNTATHSCMSGPSVQPCPEPCLQLLNAGPQPHHAKVAAASNRQGRSPRHTRKLSPKGGQFREGRKSASCSTDRGRVGKLGAISAGVLPLGMPPSRPLNPWGGGGALQPLASSLAGVAPQR